MKKLKHQVLRVLNRLLFTYYVSKTKRSKRKGVVLMFHHVSDVMESPYNVTPSVFDCFLQKISSKNVINLENIQQEENFYSITFDDVPDNFYFNAFPLLKKYKIPFTLFISTSLLNTKGYLSKDQLVEISTNKLATIGSHGVTHDYFVKFDKKRYINELEMSKQIIEGIIHKPVKMFAFPYGSYTTCGLFNKHLVLKYYKFGFSTIPTYVTSEKVIQDYFIPRINCDEELINEFLN